jgi:hypothetical protein
MNKLFIRMLKKSKLVKQLYNEYAKDSKTISIPEITPINCRISKNENLRLNIFLPSIDNKHIFGGIHTAIKFYNELAKATDAYLRIILTDAFDKDDISIENFKDYEFIDCNNDSMLKKSIIPFNDRYNKTIPVGKNDIFVYSAWWTAYNAQQIAEWQSNIYKIKIKPLIYLIQDYEPIFYPASARFALAESTYQYKYPQIAVVNSKQLSDFFINRNYPFSKYYYFEPTLHSQLKFHLLKLLDSPISKKKIVMVYGRPQTDRNAFYIVVESLRCTIENLKNCEQWEFVSLGDDFEDISIGKGKILKSLGKLSIDGYANILKDSYAGISLMISPHPSYPPLEMAAFGVKVITNNFWNKDLSNWNKNITSVSDVKPNVIGSKLSEFLNAYEENCIINKNDINNIYLDGEKNQFSMVGEIANILNEYKI